jgi:plastocyanin
MNLRNISRGIAAALVTCVCVGCSKQSATPPAHVDTAIPAAPAGGDASGQNVVAGQLPIVNGQLSFVVLQPTTERELPPQGQLPVMDQISLTFIPRVLLVRTGEPTEFRNNDDELHNVRVSEAKTREGTFNVAIPTGANYVHTFKRDGFYDVGCDIHPGMSAIILASSTPYAAVTDAAGKFEMYDVPAGSYAMTVYVGTEEIRKPLEVASGHTDASVTR